MYSQSEIVNLVLGIAIIPILVSSRPGIPSRFTNWFVAAYCFMLLAYVSTVAEGYIAPVAFNLIEHGSLAVAGVLFAIALMMRRRELDEILKDR